MRKSVYKFILIDEFGGAIRKFASKREAMPYLTKDMKLIKLPAQPSRYELALSLLGESPC